MDDDIWYEHPGVAIIHDAQIKFIVTQFGKPIHVLVHVKGTKGEGTADADKKTDLEPRHFDLLNILLEPKNKDRVWTANEIHGAVKFWLHNNNRQQEARTFDKDHWKRPISELLRKKILVHPEGTIKRYRLVCDRAIRENETGKLG